jgi:hypothetical protein
MEEGAPALSRAAERREELREAMGALESALAAPIPGRVEQWWDDARAALAGLGRVWERHAAGTEEPGGLFDEVLAQAPRLAHSVDKLRREHIAIGEELTQLAGRDAGDGGDALRAAGLDLLRHLAHHRHLGADLLHEAYTVDIAVGD